MYKAHILQVETGCFLESQAGEIFGFTNSYNNRLCFFDKADAESTLELMNDLLSECYVLIEESATIVYLVVMDWKYEGEEGVEIEAFDNLELAESYLDSLVEKEQITSWIKDASNLVEEYNESNRYYAYDKEDEGQPYTHIYIEEKGVNKEA